jgi:hypothetical protein
MYFKFSAAVNLVMSTSKFVSWVHATLYFWVTISADESSEQNIKQKFSNKLSSALWSDKVIKTIYKTTVENTNHDLRPRVFFWIKIDQNKLKCHEKWSFGVKTKLTEVI